MNQTQRRTYLIQPKLQTKLVGSFVGLATLALLLQFLFLGMRLIPMARSLPGGSELAGALPGVILQVMAFSLLILLPIIFCLGIRITLKIAGPLYRFERFFEEVKEGQRTDPCRLRQGDELQALCEMINEATAERRASNASAGRVAA